VTPVPSSRFPFPLVSRRMVTLSAEPSESSSSVLASTAPAVLTPTSDPRWCSTRAAASSSEADAVPSFTSTTSGIDAGRLGLRSVRTTSVPRLVTNW